MWEDRGGRGRWGRWRWSGGERGRGGTGEPLSGSGDRRSGRAYVSPEVELAEFLEGLEVGLECSGDGDGATCETERGEGLQGNKCQLVNGGDDKGAHTCSCDLKTAQTESSRPGGGPPYSSRTDQNVSGACGEAGWKRDARWEEGSLGRLKICAESQEEEWDRKDECVHG